ncbi:MAG: hypothetical protein ACKVOA_09415 [Methylophilaceae bacterium]
MLPLWSDRLHFVLAPDKVTMVRFSGGLQPREVLAKSIDCAALDADQALWQPAFNAMQKLLAVAGGKADVKIMLSSHFVRYVLVPVQADLKDEAEEEAYVRFCFVEVYGEDAKDWTLRWNGALAVDQQIASAIDRNFLAAIEQSAKNSNMKLCSVQPYLMSAFNLVRKHMVADEQWFVLVESGNACLSSFTQGECTTLRTVRLDDDWQETLPRLLAREFLIAGADNKSRDLLLCAPQHVDLGTLQLKGWNMRALTINANALLKGKFTPGGIRARA